jgi:small subunit ribosomal protein S6
MAKVSAKYEAMIVFSVRPGEEAIKASLEKFKHMISENGTLINVNEWGKRRLAYLIDDEADGYYVLIHFESKPDFPAELERVFNITDGILRTLITIMPERIGRPIKAETPEKPAQ